MPNILKQLCMLALLMMTVVNVNAQDSEDEFLPNSHELSIEWDFKGDIIVRQIAYNYSVLNGYLGIGCGLGVWRETEAGSVFSQEFWEEDSGLGRLFILPKLKISTPFFVKKDKIKIKSFVENGLMLNRKFTRTIVAWNNDWTESRNITFTSRAISYNMTLGVYMELSDRGGISVGYSYSTLEYSKKADYYNINNPLTSDNLHGIFLSVNINL
ncbi:MAG: hypothetical protein J5595_06825 [Bacteroidales bacterium]|nr:hypothetical protein [Bacteroidales bacterium]